MLKSSQVEPASMGHVAWPSAGSFERKLYIDGSFVDAADGRTFLTVNPATGLALCEVAAAGSVDVDRAVASSRRAFESRVWSGQSAAFRKRVLHRLADLLESHADSLATIETLDTGKPISDTRKIDLPSSIQMVRWFAEAVDKMYDEIAPTDPHIVASIRRVPLGVVAAVVPWNFPLLTALTKAAPALAVGNCVIIKPSELSPLTALWLGRLASEAGVPDGVLNVLPGLGPITGKALGLHMDVDALLFTGSTATGKCFMAYSAESNLKKISLECGGKSANIIMDDCPDVGKAVVAASQAIFFNSGQICNAGSRLILQRGIANAFLEELRKTAEGLQPADPLLPDTRLGPMISSEHASKVRGYIALAREEGARQICGERPSTGLDLNLSPQCYVWPTIFDQVENSMRIAREEVFGPVLAVLTVDSLDAAIAVANDSPYGLASAIWTRDMNQAHRAQQALNTGFVWVNSVRAGHISTPFGGMKQSGFGRDKSLHAFEGVTALKTTWIDYSA